MPTGKAKKSRRNVVVDDDIFNSLKDPDALKVKHFSFAFASSVDQHGLIHNVPTKLDLTPPLNVLFDNMHIVDGPVPMGSANPSDAPHTSTSSKTADVISSPSVKTKTSTKQFSVHQLCKIIVKAPKFIKRSLRTLVVIRGAKKKKLGKATPKAAKAEAASEATASPESSSPTTFIDGAAPTPATDNQAPPQQAEQIVLSDPIPVADAAPHESDAGTSTAVPDTSAFQPSTDGHYGDPIVASIIAALDSLSLGSAREAKAVAINPMFLANVGQSWEDIMLELEPAMSAIPMSEPSIGGTFPPFLIELQAFAAQMNEDVSRESRAATSTMTLDPTTPSSDATLASPLITPLMDVTEEKSAHEAKDAVTVEDSDGPGGMEVEATRDNAGDMNMGTTSPDDVPRESNVPSALPNPGGSGAAMEDVTASTYTQVIERSTDPTPIEIESKEQAPSRDDTVMQPESRNLLSEAVAEKQPAVQLASGPMASPSESATSTFATTASSTSTAQTSSMNCVNGSQPVQNHHMSVNVKPKQKQKALPKTSIIAPGVVISPAPSLESFTWTISPAEAASRQPPAGSVRCVTRYARAPEMQAIPAIYHSAAAPTSQQDAKAMDEDKKVEAKASMEQVKNKAPPVPVNPQPQTAPRPAPQPAPAAQPQPSFPSAPAPQRSLKDTTAMLRNMNSNLPPSTGSQLSHLALPSLPGSITLQKIEPGVFAVPLPPSGSRTVAGRQFTPPSGPTFTTPVDSRRGPAASQGSVIPPRCVASGAPKTGGKTAKGKEEDNEDDDADALAFFAERLASRPQRAAPAPAMMPKPVKPKTEIADKGKGTEITLDFLDELKAGLKSQKKPSQAPIAIPGPSQPTPARFVAPTVPRPHAHHPTAISGRPMVPPSPASANVGQRSESAVLQVGSVIPPSSTTPSSVASTEATSTGEEINAESGQRVIKKSKRLEKWQVDNNVTLEDYQRRRREMQAQELDSELLSLTTAECDEVDRTELKRTRRYGEEITWTGNNPEMEAELEAQLS